VAATFVTLDQAKARLRITSTDEDIDLQAMLDQAEAHILTWCSVTPRCKAVADAWTPATVPPAVVAAILVQLSELDRFRGDDLDPPPRPDTDAGPSVLVRELLRAYHDMALA
jgi:hypothetical protein